MIVKQKSVVEKMGIDSDDPRLEWKPTREEFGAYMKRDEELAFGNMRQVLKDAGREVSFRDIRECLLHSLDTVEYVLDQLIRSGEVSENRGRFAMAPQEVTS